MRPQCSVFIATSVDGFIARADGSFDWLQIHDLAAEPNGYVDFIATCDAIVIGRGTYETVLGLGGWFYGDKRVVVMTHRDYTSTNGETFYAGDPHGLLEQLAGAKRIYVDGGNVIQQFFAADLIDDVTIGVVPIVLGGGIRLFPGGEGEHRLTLEGSRIYKSGMAQLSYRVQR
jgi:dihydrofolate reductase